MDKLPYKNYKKDRILLYPIELLIEKLKLQSNGLTYEYIYAILGVLVPIVAAFFIAESSSTIYIMAIIVLSPVALMYYSKYRKAQLMIYKLMLNNNDIDLGSHPKYLVEFGEKDPGYYINGSRYPIKVSISHWDQQELIEARSYFYEKASKYAKGQIIDYFDSDESIDMMIKENWYIYNLNTQPELTRARSKVK